MSYLNAGTEGPLSPRRRRGGPRADRLRDRRGPLRQGVLRGLLGCAVSSGPSYARVFGAPPCRRRADRLDDRRLNTVLSGPRPSRRGRDPHHRRGAPRPAGPARAARAARTASTSGWCRSRRSPTRSTPAHAAGRVLARLLGQRAGSSTPRRWRRPACRSCSTPRRRSARSRSTSRSSAARSTPRSGQKWLCGPEGSGCLYVRAEQLDELLVPWPGYTSLADPTERAATSSRPRAPRGWTTAFRPAMRSAWTLASLEVFEEAGWDVGSRARGVAARPRWPSKLADRGLEVLPARAARRWCRGSRPTPRPTSQRSPTEDVVVRFIAAFGVVRGRRSARGRPSEELERGSVDPRSTAVARPAPATSSQDPLRVRCRRSSAPAARTRTASDRGRRPVRSPASSGRRRRPGSVRRRRPPSARARTTAGR